MHGLFYWLTLLPVTGTFAVLVVVCLGLTMEIRERTEGTSYTASKSSFPGIPILIGCALMAVPIIQRGVHISHRLSDGWYHFVCFLLAICWAVVAQILATKQSRWTPKVTAADTYHNVVAAPLQLFLLLALTPVVWMYGSTREVLTMVLLFAVWLGLLAYDWATGRLDQRKWMRDNYFEDVLRTSRFR